MKDTRKVTCPCGQEREVEEKHSGYQLYFMYTDTRNCSKCGQYYRPGDLMNIQAYNALTR